MTIAPNSTPNQPGWVAEHDENGDQTHAMGPSIWEAGVDIYTASDPHSGPQAYDADGHLIPAGDLLRCAVQLLRLHDELRRAQRQHTQEARK